MINILENKNCSPSYLNFVMSLYENISNDYRNKKSLNKNDDLKSFLYEVISDNDINIDNRFTIKNIKVIDIEHDSIIELSFELMHNIFTYNFITHEITI